MTKGWHGEHVSQKKLVRNENMRRDFRNGQTVKKLMTKYGVTRQRVYQLCNGLGRRHHALDAAAGPPHE